MVLPIPSCISPRSSLPGLQVQPTQPSVTSPKVYRSDFSKRQPSKGSSGKAGKQDFPFSRGLQSCQVLHSQAPGGGPRAFYHCISVIAASSWSRKYGKPFTWWKALARNHGCLVSCDFTVLSRRLAREKVDLARPVKVTVFLLFFSNLT